MSNQYDEKSVNSVLAKKLIEEIEAKRNAPDDTEITNLINELKEIRNKMRFYRKKINKLRKANEEALCELEIKNYMEGKV